MRRLSSFKKRSLYTNIKSSFVLSKLQSAVVIGTMILSTTGCSMPKSWSESLSEGRQAIKSGDYAKAETSLQSAIDAAKAKFGQNAGQTATCMTDLAEMYMAQQEYRKASKIFKELVPIYEKLEPGSQDALRIEAEFKDVKMKIKKYQLEPDEAEPIDSKTDAAKTDAGKTDAGKADAGKADAGKADAGKADAGKADAGKPDAAKPDSAKTDSAKTDVKTDTKSESQSSAKTESSNSKDAVANTAKTKSSDNQEEAKSKKSESQAADSKK
jgi:hypothetical protein